MSNSEPQAAEGRAPVKFAVRQKSGLVRTAGGWDSFVFSLSGISVGIMAAWGLFFGTAFYPGANITLAVIISTLVGAAIAFGYRYWSLVFPRSGGDYVFLSRGLHPGIALGANFVFLVILLASPALVMGIFQPLTASFAGTLASATGAGWLNNLSAWLMTNPGFGVAGGVYVLAAVGAGLFGLRGQLRWLQIQFLVAGIGTIILIVALLFSTSDTFVTNLQAIVGATPSQIQDAAVKGGFATGGFDLTQTIKLTNWYAPSLFFALILVYIGGEIKNVQRTVRWAMLGAVAFSGLATIALQLSIDHVIPENLQGALAYNALVVGSDTTPNLPYAYELMRILWGTQGFGLLLTIIAYVTFAAWIGLWWEATLAFAQRGIFAWSLDGMVPKWVSNVRLKGSAPIPSLLIAGVIMQSWITLFAAFPSFRTIVLLVPVYAMLALTLAVGAAFPYFHKELFSQSVVASDRFLGIPSMTVVCGVAAAIVLAATYVLWTDSIASGVDRRPVWVTAGVVVVIALYYIGLRLYRLSRGQDMAAVFKEIPVE